MIILFICGVKKQKKKGRRILNMASFFGKYEITGIRLGKQAIEALYIGLEAIWEAALRIWKGRQLWKSKETWKH